MRLLVTIINDFCASLKDSYIEWKNILINPNYCRRDKEITWNRRLSQMMPVNSTILDVISLIENQQYSFQVSLDESIIQLYYKFSNENIITSANLAYYGAIPWGAMRLTKKNDKEGNSFGQVQSQVTPEIENEYVSWIRIDYDSACEKPSIIHHLAHLHIAGISSGRIPFDTLPSPFQFID